MSIALDGNILNILLTLVHLAIIKTTTATKAILISTGFINLLSELFVILAFFCGRLQ